MTTTAIVPFNPQEAVQLAIAMKHVVMAVSSEVLVENVDFGKIPGTDKNVLLKPGAERLCSAFKLSPHFEVVSQVEDFDKGFFFYRYSCALIHRETGEVYGRGIGSCNSQENKYGWRWVSAPPSHLDASTLVTRAGALREPKFAIDKGETGGKYGKPAEYWQAFRDALANGTARRVDGQKTKDGRPLEVYEIGGLEYRVPNPDVFDLVNTIDKMAQKRALIAATLIATNASEFFTQDMEDFASDSVRLPAASQPIVEAQFEEVTASPTPRASQAVLTPPAPFQDGPLSSKDETRWSAFLKWCDDKFGYNTPAVMSVLKPVLKDGVFENNKSIAMATVLASAAGYDNGEIRALGKEHKLPSEVVSEALLINAPDIPL
jgi:hypothetical protein